MNIEILQQNKQIILVIIHLDNFETNIGMNKKWLPRYVLQHFHPPFKYRENTPE